MDVLLIILGLFLILLVSGCLSIGEYIGIGIGKAVNVTNKLVNATGELLE